MYVTNITHNIYIFFFSFIQKFGILYNVSSENETSCLWKILKNSDVP